jgi:hypothetical protein
VSFQDELIDIGGLEGVHASEGEVVNDEQLGDEEATEGLVVRVVSAGAKQLFEQIVSTNEQDLETGATGGVAEGTCQESLSDPGGPHEDDVFVTMKEPEAEEVSDAVPIEVDGCVPIELFEGLRLGEARPGEPLSEIALLAAVDLVLEHELEKIIFGQLRLSRIGDTVRQGGEHAREA